MGRRTADVLHCLGGIRVFQRQTGSVAGIRRAAIETAGDLTRFVSTAAIRAARTTIDEYGVSSITDDIRERFYSLLLDPPAPNGALIKLIASAVPDGYELES
jgi:uncharacterized protein (DUF1778 family)